MKIAIVSVGNLPLPPTKGGAVENLIYHLINENEIQKKFEFLVFSPYEEEAIRISKSYKLTNFKYINTNNWLFRLKKICRYLIKRIFRCSISNQYITEVKKELIKNEVDCIVIENKPEFALSLKNFKSTEIIQHIHNDYLSKSTKINKKILDSSDKVIMVSDFLIKSVEWYGHSKKFKLLHNGIDTNYFNAARWKNEAEKLREDLGIKEGDIVILYSGRLNAGKGILELINIFKSINKQELKLLVVGASWYSEEKENDFIKKLKKNTDDLKGKIYFTGYVAYNKMPIIYSAADIVVVPSIATEAAGLVAIEGRAAGKPLIVTDSGGLPEYAEASSWIIKRNKDFKDSFSKAIIETSENEKLRTRMSEYSMNNIDKFDKKNYYNNFISLLS
ncbi:glycosyltransferase family 4 protein [Salinicoccus roseus]|uniref:glycosyltransferase family 4 protein n=1 Tax=Salinicoccus roseus TaxID=45670 RepID=UPI001CA6372A|nr:glycosyltransferase family 4 protein [Salinicoccus roseus]MBY8908369.1 glycosyltransferase family 4 protein [Salinicoccus roseus]